MATSSILARKVIPNQARKSAEQILKGTNRTINIDSSKAREVSAKEFKALISRNK